MSTGVIQRYTGAAAVDAKHQIIVEAPAHGTASEQEVLLPMVDGLRAQELLMSATVLTADAGYHSEDNLKGLADRQVEALIAEAGPPRVCRLSRCRGSTSRSLCLPHAARPGAVRAGR